MMQAPCLLTGLKNALLALQNSRHMDSAAHDHLLHEIQNRNTKRKIRSIIQKTMALNGQQQSQLSDIPMGSAWLACLYILCQSSSSNSSNNHLDFHHDTHERLFVAQILLKRLRRVPIAESVDIEMEVRSTDVEAELQYNVQHLRELYEVHLRECCPLIGTLLHGKRSIGDDEETVKAETTIVALSAIACFEAAHPSPLYQTVVLALATALFRLRYTTSMVQRPNPPCLIELLRNISLQIGLQNDSVIWHTVSVLPDAILGSPGGARGRMSTDAQLIHQASRDLRTIDTQLLVHAPSHILVETCTRWVAFLPLSHATVDRLLQLPHHELTDEFWLAFFESASLSKEQIVCSLLGMSNAQPKTNRSKKRRQNIVEDASTEETWNLAQSECQLRGDLACHAAPFYSSSDPLVISACANACLPHLLRNNRNQELFQQIAKVFCKAVCASNERKVRSLAFEPLYSLHSTALECHGVDSSFLANHFASYVQRRAERARYPDFYFDRMDAESDHDLEVERNDVRDLIRTVSCSGEGGSTAKTEQLIFPSELSIKVLHKLLSDIGMDSETSLHAFSALAKSINTLAGCCARRSSIDHESRQLLDGSLEYMISVNRLVLNAFSSEVSIQQVLPLSRITSIMNCSFSPFLSYMGIMNRNNPSLDALLKLIIETSLSSLERLPELLAASVLEHSSYDIRGTMRGPGGEDHVGCLALMRLVSESTTLTDRVTEAIELYARRFENLYFRLSAFDLQRGIGNHHGVGVAPQTRRIMIGTICKMERKLKALIDRIANTTMTDVVGCCSKSYDDVDLHSLVELTLDLAAFPPRYVAEFLSDANGDMARRCFEGMTSVCLTGYDFFAVSTDPSVEKAIYHWNRLRAALYLLMKKGSIVLSKIVSSMIYTFIRKECAVSQAACVGCAANPCSKLFRDDLISVDGIPAGVFIQNIVHFLSSPHSMNSETLHLLELCMMDVRTLILLPVPKSFTFCDPRETIAESWFEVARIVAADQNQVAVTKERFLTDITSIVFHLIFMSSMAKTQEERSHSPVMSLDGPQTLAMISFLSTFLGRGVSVVEPVLRAVATQFHVRSLKQIDTRRFPFMLLNALFFRGCSGALPPWAIEAMPELYSLFYEVMGSDPELFCFVLRSSIDMIATEQLGSVAPGHPIAGPLFRTMPERMKESFAVDMLGVLNRNDRNKWREIKAVVKRLCGGKKKETDYGQKPHNTKWEFDRV